MFFETHFLVVGVFLVGLPQRFGVRIAQLAVVGGLIDLSHCIEVFVALVVDLAVFCCPFEGIRLGLTLFVAVRSGGVDLLARV